MPSDFVEIEGIAIAGEVTANVVKRKEASIELELEGPVDAFDNISFNWIRVLGLTYNVDPGAGGTDFPGFADAAAFFGQLDVGDVVEIEDEDADGEADEIELD